MNFNDKDLYPTPKEVIETMLLGVDLEGKVVLEPSAGFGNIVEVLKEYGAKVIVCEKDNELAGIVSQKADSFLKNDFMEVKAEEISHIDLIIANPPFSQDMDHILKMYEVAPEGCEIISLCNYDTFRRGYGSKGRELKKIVELYGNYTELGQCFTTAERKTNVEVTLVHIYKPKVNSETEFDGYFDEIDTDEKGSDIAGIMPHNEMRSIVNTFVSAVKMFDEVDEASDKINNLIKYIAEYPPIEFGGFATNSSTSTKITRETFKKDMQKDAWRKVFNKMNMSKYVTASVMQDINKFVEKQTKVPFTMSNISKMIDLIIGTHKERMDNILVEAFDKIISFSDKNRRGVEGWKTNSAYKVNQRFIEPYVCDYDNRWPNEYLKISYSSGTYIDDIVKALCYMTATDYDEIGNLAIFVSNRSLEWGKWHNWNKFFKIRGYKKGTMHFEFADLKVWEEFNKRVGKLKGWTLPEETDNKQKGTERTKEKEVEIY